MLFTVQEKGKDLWTGLEGRSAREKVISAFDTRERDGAMNA